MCIRQEFQFRLSPSQILSGCDSLKEELNRTDETSYTPSSSQRECRKRYPTSVNWKVPTSKGKEPTLEEFKTLFDFWDDFLSLYGEKLKEGLEVKTVRKEHCDAFRLLWSYKDQIKNNPQKKDKLLEELELKIERSSMMFDEESILNNSGMLIHKLVRGKYKGECPNIFSSDISVDDVPFTNNMNVHRKVNDEYTDEELLNVPNAKEYLLLKLTSQHDIGVLNSMGDFTLECIIIYVLGLLLNNPSSERSHMVRLATLIEKLDTTVRSHAEIESNQGVSKNRVSNQKGGNTNFSQMSDKQSKYECTNYAIGVALLEFLLHKDFLTVLNQNNENHTGHVLIKTKRSRYYKPMPLYVSLTFDRNLLPIMLSLPMVYPPLMLAQDDSHGSKINQNVKPPLLFFRSGYLLNVSKDIIEGARLLSTPNVHHYDVRFHNGAQAEKLVSVMKALQEVPYRINHPWLKTIISDYDLLVRAGLLLPKKLATMELKSACSILREAYLKNTRIQKLYSYNDILSTLTRNIQKARYEGFIIELAEALDGYQIYFPVYLDFRGRISRSGILNFHECDFTKALLQFVPDHTNDTSPIKGELAGLTSQEVKTIHIATGFHLKKFINNEEAYKCYSNIKEIISKVSNKSEFYQLASLARHPFQFIANITILHSVQWKDWMEGIPIHLEASASAYQILSYFSLDEEIATQTNLIRDYKELRGSKEHKIHDIYEFLKEQLLQYAYDFLNLSNRKIQVLSDHLDRSLVKSIFMSMIYGKTLHSIAADINTKLSTLKYEDSLTIAVLCFRFWGKQYSHVENLKTLIRLISSVVASANQPVWLGTKYFDTIQDYIRLRSNNIWIQYFDKIKKTKSRKKVTMKVFTNKRDRRKTVNNTFLNFIHQTDASIAMDMVLKAKPKPLYTVLDGFITTAKHSEYLPNVYSNILIEMGPPIIHVNKFIYNNVIVPVLKVLEPEMKKEGIDYYENIEDEIPFAFDDLEQYLTYYIIKFIIKDDTNQEIPESWKKKIHDIAIRYKSYANTTYSYDNPKRGYTKKWHPFVEGLFRGSYYCLHL